MTDRKNQLLDAALTIARKRGYTKVTREAIAEAVGCVPATVSNHLGTTPNMKRGIMRAAVAKGVIEVIAQGLADGNPHAKKAPHELKEKAVAHLMG